MLVRGFLLELRRWRPLLGPTRRDPSFLSVLRRAVKLEAILGMDMHFYGYGSSCLGRYLEAPYLGIGMLSVIFSACMPVWRPLQKTLHLSVILLRLLS